MFVANLVEIHSLMRPADMFLFVKYEDNNKLFSAERENVIGEVTGIGAMAQDHEFLVKQNGEAKFERGLNMGEKILFRLGSVYHKIIENGETILCLPMKEVLCCLR